MVQKRKQRQKRDIMKSKNTVYLQGRGKSSTFPVTVGRPECCSFPLESVWCNQAVSSRGLPTSDRCDHRAETGRRPSRPGQKQQYQTHSGGGYGVEASYCLLRWLRGHSIGSRGAAASVFQFLAPNAFSIATTVCPVLEPHSTNQKRNRSQVLEES